MSARLVLLSLALAGAAHADLAPRGADWDGLGRWVTALESTAIDVRTPDALDLATLPAGAGLALIGAPPAADTAGLRRFVQEGGRLLMAIEGPELDALARAFEAGVVPAPAEGPRLGGHPALHVLRSPRGGLFRGVDHLVANHPVGLTAPERLGAAVRFADGTGFAYHLRVGEGEALLLGDASLFINLMLDAGDNARFAANVGAWLGRDGEAPVFLAGATTAVDGAYGAPTPDPDGEGPVAALNEALRALGGDTAPDDLAIHFFLALLLAGVLMYAVTVFPGSEPGADPAAPPFPPGAEVERAAGAPGGPADPDARRMGESS